MSDPPREVEALLAALDEARAGLLAACEGVTPETFVRTPPGRASEATPATDAPGNVRDILWHAGLLDDWCRLLIDQALGGRPLAAWRAAARPAHLDTPELLREWLTQTRGALLARARRLSDADLDREFVLPEGEARSPRRLIEELARQDRVRASRVRSLPEG